METKKIAGWLILHTENTESLTYELREGKNFIGRQATNYKPDIAIADTYVSRRHAVIVVRVSANYVYEYFIADNADIQGAPSMNGTYVNGETQRITENAVKLKDGDTIQVGMTKLVLKTADVAIDVENAVKLVNKMEYKETVDFNIPAVTLRTIKKK